MVLLQNILLGPFNLVETLVSKVVHYIVFVCCIYTLCHKTGLVRRVLRRLVELRLRELTNGSLVTLTSIEFDLGIISSEVVITDLIIHSPDRIQWRWDSPIIVRFGHISASFHLLSLLDLPSFIRKFLGWKVYMPVMEVYELRIDDVQLFLEKRLNVFNFHLLDCSLDIPQPDDIFVAMEKFGSKNSYASSGCDIGCYPISQTVSKSGSDSTLTGGNKRVGSHKKTIHKIVAVTSSSTSSRGAENRAQEIVTNVLGAVSNLGRAANEGGTCGLQSALMDQRDGIIGQLRQLRSLMVFENGGNSRLDALTSRFSAENASECKSKSNHVMVAKESIDVMKQVGRVMEKNVLDMKQQMDALSSPPPRKESYLEVKKTNLFRFGRIVLTDIRIFTKDVILVGHSDVKPFGTRLENDTLSSSVGFFSEKGRRSLLLGGKEGQHVNTTEGWRKPIYINKVAVGGAELYPTFDSRVSENSPPIGQDINKIMSVVGRCLISEIAKSNSGQLLNTAFAEVFSFLQVKLVNETNKLKEGVQ